MLGNLQLFVASPEGMPEGYVFNMYAYTMTHNPLIKIISYGNYFFILLHAFQGILISIYNKKAKGGRYQGRQISDTQAKMSSRNMVFLGLLLLAFIGLHMYQFWAQMHFNSDMPVMEDVLEDGHPVKDLFAIVKVAFKQWWVVVTYLLSLAALAAHLVHGFWSAFQSMGLSNKKYGPLIRFVAMSYAILIPLGFATMPVVFLFFY
jgi:succinate dehydrogenase / fumarate reductase cytochrome b subunit